MSHEKCRNELLKNLEFIKKLIATRKSKIDFLSHSSDQELDFILDFLNWVVTGKIAVTKNIFQKLSKERKISYLNKYFDDQNFQKTKGKKRYQKINILKNISTFLPLIFKILKK